MRSLNIPLDRTRTARRHGRAVWRWGSILVGAFFFFAGLRAVSTHNPFANYVTDDTVATLFLKPTRKEWNTLIALAGTEPIGLSGLTLKEAGMLAKGGMSLSFLKDGQVRLGIKATLDESTRTSLLATGIQIHEAPHHLLFLDTSESAPTWSENTSISTPILQRLHPTFIGTLSTKEEQATLLHNQQGIVLTLPGRLPQKPLSTPLPESLVAYGSFTEFDSLSIPDFLEHGFQEASGGASLTSTLFSSKTGGSITLFENETYLLTGSGEETPLPLLQKFLILQAQLRNPTETLKRLPDGTSVSELRIDTPTELPTPSEVGGWNVFQLDQGSQHFFAGKQKETGEIFFTNSGEAFIRKTSTRTSETNKERRPDALCGKTPIFFIHTGPFVSLIQSGQHNFSTTTPLANSLFVHVSIDKHIFGSKIHLCVDN